MSEATATVVAPKTSKNNSTPKKKVTPSANGKHESNGKVEKKGLRKPQIRILELLNKSKVPLSRKEISSAAEVDNAFLTEYLGSNDEEIRRKNDEKVFPSLRTLALVKTGTMKGVNDKEINVYEITAKGRQVVAKLAK